jgi:hypothetical protein
MKLFVYLWNSALPRFCLFVYSRGHCFTSGGGVDMSTPHTVKRQQIGFFGRIGSLLMTGMEKH